MTLLLPPGIKGLKCNLWRLAYLYLYFSSMANTFYFNTYLVFTPVYTFDQEKCSRVQNTFGWWNQINCRPYKWTESHRIWKVEPLLTMPYHCVFVLLDYGLISHIIESNKSIWVNQPILTNRYQWIDFIQSKRRFSSNIFFVFP